MKSTFQLGTVGERIKQVAAIASCASLMAGLLMVPAMVTPAMPDGLQTATNSAIATTTRLEVHLKSRQAILYQGDTIIKRYAIGTGRPGWETPVGTFQIRQMKRNPTWISPFTNERIASSDPRNPLRGYWIGFWTNGKNWIGFHGTLDASTVGKPASHGCIHMYDHDLQELFSLVSLGTEVKVIP